ncbi:PhoH family protein [Caldisericum exile]|uniref:PhoH-like protein n=1 Tax=Caldisericum exile (strain DSM 21853 / NBRC 104410 / AZM16c01) TaxID=511051 RepID=A0A7U6GEL8_CALEA|nr:PhoH family protein [Caldisericum exile]BAL80950.1 PhoH-like protein [Caldisericum exile AZM16c01]
MGEETEVVKLKNPKNIIKITGVLDENFRVIEKNLNVKITLREEKLYVSGKKENVQIAKKILKEIEQLAEKKYPFSIEEVIYSTKIKDGNFLKELPETVIIEDIKGRGIIPKTLGQKKFVEAINNNDITFVIGPAGTGKTYLSVAVAVKYLLSNKVSRIILTRPVVEVGEKIGYLPGDIQQKVDPYFRPIYDALFEFLGQEKTQRLINNKTIEIAPLAFMRGRTLNDAFIIMDEAQNTTFSQMKMFLTRLGIGSKMVVTGDLTQSDLLAAQGKNGLELSVEILRDVDGIEFVYLDVSDIVRHSLVQKIINAYEKFENKSKDKNRS